MTLADTSDPGIAPNTLEIQLDRFDDRTIFEVEFPEILPVYTSYGAPRPAMFCQDPNRIHRVSMVIPYGIGLAWHDAPAIERVNLAVLFSPGRRVGSILPPELKDLVYAIGSFDEVKIEEYAIVADQYIGAPSPPPVAHLKFSGRKLKLEMTTFKEAQHQITGATPCN